MVQDGYQIMSTAPASEPRILIERDQFCVIIKPENVEDYQHPEYFGISPFVARDLKTKIHLLHRTKYSIGVVSFSNYDAIARISVNGKLIGCFYCHGQQTTFISRPININKAFVFVSSNSNIAVRSGSDINSPTAGVIQIAIYPQDVNIPSNIYSPSIMPWESQYRSSSAATDMSGGSKYGSACSPSDTSAALYRNDICDGPGCN